MKHTNEQQLILYHYGESAEREAIERHLADCESCHAEYQALRGVLAAVDEMAVPERSESYPRQVWQGVEAALPRRSGWFGWPRLSMAAAVAMLFVVVFIAGQWRGSRMANSQPVSESAKERVLLVAVGAHLERSERALIELMNASGNGEIDLAGQRERAARLASDNRLYRRTAGHSGEKTIEGLLEELERVLIEIANSPEKISPADWSALRRRIESRGLMMKIEVIEEDARERGEFQTARQGANRV